MASPELTEHEQFIRRRAAVFTFFSLDIYRGDEGINFSVLERQNALGVILTAQEIMVARDLRTILPEPEGFESVMHIGDDSVKGDMRLATYGQIRMSLGIHILGGLEGEFYGSNIVRQMLEQDPSGVVLVQNRLNHWEDRAHQGLLNNQNLLEATLRFAAVNNYVAQVINPEAEYKDEDPYWIHEPDSECRVTPLSEGMIYRLPLGVRKHALRELVYEQTGYVEEEGRIILADVLSAQGARLFYDVYTGRVNYYLGDMDLHPCNSN